MSLFGLLGSWFTLGLSGSSLLSWLLLCLGLSLGLGFGWGSWGLLSGGDWSLLASWCLLTGRFSRGRFASGLSFLDVLWV